MRPAEDGRRVFCEFRFLGFGWLSDIIGGDYMRRWVLRTPWCVFRLHHILRGDGDRHFHDHPFDFSSLVLRGGYIEHRPNAAPRRLRAGHVLRRQAEDLHRLELNPGKTAWTLVVAKPARRGWGFQTEQGWIPADAYNAWRDAHAEKG